MKWEVIAFAEIFFSGCLYLFVDDSHCSQTSFLQNWWIKISHKHQISLIIVAFFLNDALQCLWLLTNFYPCRWLLSLGNVLILHNTQEEGSTVGKNLWGDQAYLVQNVFWFFNFKSCKVFENLIKKFVRFLTIWSKFVEVLNDLIKKLKGF